ncbi:Arc family DNA-binding protein [Sulfitobacter geojensis]|uniref:Arc family DNA-binding protein n=1 Tax=Sulfitobacter geojensis TaxID=1342299 RepID=UPI0007DA02A1|nr:Arc family DNA-binding protein [Sulfitobacter geojensis]OAN86270.1 DNA-binding protein [Sulfitobacter geojensis]
MKTRTVQFQMRLPPDLKDWIAAQAAANVSSQNSEIIRAIRERMERTETPAT